MTTQLTDQSWQKLAEETRREIDRITNIRNLLNPQELADRAVQCDRKALLAKWVELRNTFIDLGERYRALARKASQQKHPSFAKPRLEKMASRRLALTVSPSLQPCLPLLSSDNPQALVLDLN
jgi:hypothetical protein